MNDVRKCIREFGIKKGAANTLQASEGRDRKKADPLISTVHISIFCPANATGHKSHFYTCRHRMNQIKTPTVRASMQHAEIMRQAI